MKKIALTSQEIKIVSDILKNISDVIVFGSRIKETHSKFSDLDLCIKSKISAYEFESVREAFENSDLSFKVDVVDYHRISDSFRKIIDEHGVEWKEIID
jgi:predicted nucleotidyltransferase